MANINEIANYILQNAEYQEDDTQLISFEEIAEGLEIELTEVSSKVEQIENELMNISGIDNVTITNSSVIFKLDEDTENYIDEDLDYTEEEKENDDLLDEVIQEETQKGNEDLFELSSNPNLSTKEKAKKMTNLYLLVLKKYFQKECEKDPYFKNKYKAELLENCWNYCQKLAKNQANNNIAMIKSYTVFANAKAYFDDEIYIKEQKEEEERKAKAKKEEEERKAKAEQSRIEREQKEKEKAEKEQREKEREEEWQKFLANDNSCKLSESEIDMEKYKHLKQQDLFDF